LKTLKPVTWKREPSILGEHLLKRRLELGLRQRDLAQTYGFDKDTYASWEKDKNFPVISQWPKLISFLGFDPSPPATTLGKKLQAYRRQHRLSRLKLAEKLGVDEGRLLLWEMDMSKPHSKFSQVFNLLKSQ